MSAELDHELAQLKRQHVLLRIGFAVFLVVDVLLLGTWVVVSEWLRFLFH
jgi:Zn-dependent protease with chaperone function